MCVLQGKGLGDRGWVGGWGDSDFEPLESCQVNPSTPLSGQDSLQSAAGGLHAKRESARRGRMAEKRPAVRFTEELIIWIFVCVGRDDGITIKVLGEVDFMVTADKRHISEANMGR